jgi:uncharacterized protein YyaL (SSP411 family)
MPLAQKRARRIGRSAAPLLLAVLLMACTATEAHEPRTAAAGSGLVRPGTPEAVNIARARARGRTRGFEWASWSPETFERAKREKRFILLDGAAEWCHWCHVMDETTYLDPEVGRLLRERFIAVRVDIDERPDIADRYGEWGWPATILFTPEAEEIGKFRGYLPPEELIPILRDIERAAATDAASRTARRGPGDVAPVVAALPWVGARAARDMDAYFDAQQGGWGMRQKAPIGANVEFELLRHGRGDGAALKRAVFTLEQQRAILDPVWGGIYQYSAGRTWKDPHFEKLMTYQAASIEAYARGYAATRDPALLRDAQSIARYITTLLSNKDGGFLVSQDADVGAHDPKATFVDGHVFYGKDDAGRRALGMPRVDEHVYAFENGLAIAALCTLHEASRDEAALGKARRAADLVLRGHITPDGGVRHAADTSSKVVYLADAASFGRALARLAEVTGEASYREAAVRLAKSMLHDLEDTETGAFFGHTPDPAAAGVFTRRERPFNHNVTAVRFLAALSRVTGDVSYRERAARALAAVATPKALDEQGRMIGEFLLATDEIGAFPW